MAWKCLCTRYQETFTAGTLRCPPRTSSQTFQKLMDRYQLGLLLEDLTFVIEIPGDERLKDDAFCIETIDFFTSGLTKFRLNCGRLHLKSVTFKMESSGKSFLHTTDYTGKALLDCLLSLAKADVRVKRMDVLSSDWSCPLALNHIGPIRKTIDLQCNLCDLTHLELHLCNSLKFTGSYRLGLNSRPNPSSVEEAKDVSRVIQTCRSIKSLALHWNNTDKRYKSQSHEIEEQFFDHVAAIDQLSLERLDLIGIRTNETAMLAFVSNNLSLKSLKMYKTRLVHGRHKPFFDAMLAKCPSLDRVELDELQQEGESMYWGPNTPPGVFWALNGQANIFDLQEAAKACRALVWSRAGEGQQPAESSVPLNLVYTIGRRLYADTDPIHGVESTELRNHA